MSRAHPFAVRLRDLRIEVTLWLFAAGSAPLFAAIAAATWLYAAAPLPAIWLDFQLALVLDAAGLGTLDVPGWHQPAAFLAAVPGALGEHVSAAWADDFQLIQSAARAGLALIAGVFFARLAWPALTLKKEI